MCVYDEKKNKEHKTEKTNKRKKRRKAKRKFSDNSKHDVLGVEIRPC